MATTFGSAKPVPLVRCSQICGRRAAVLLLPTGNKKKIVPHPFDSRNSALPSCTDQLEEGRSDMSLHIGLQVAFLFGKPHA